MDKSVSHQISWIMQHVHMLTLFCGAFLLWIVAACPFLFGSLDLLEYLKVIPFVHEEKSYPIRLIYTPSSSQKVGVVSKIYIKIFINL
jgi:hypothetical protein